MMRFLRLVIVGLFAAAAAGCGCASTATSAGNTASPDVEQAPGSLGAPTTQAGVERALGRAQRAYLDGDWGTAVVASNQVMEGAAAPEQYYEAVKILGLASCNRRDAGPVEFSWIRLSPGDREGLQNQCAQQGLNITAAGKVHAGR